ncbi:MAG TPA: L-serine ammonia-lyase [Marmoricola sp.]|nr:L-serine ammonia-lyase [Marmoricola sp.]
MAISAFDLFKVGIGPSSSHTVGPMIAANRFVTALREADALEATASVHIELFGSLGATGHGHGSVPAIVLGLMGCQPDTVDPHGTPRILSDLEASGRLKLGGDRHITFSTDDIVLHRHKSMRQHSNAMTFEARDAGGSAIAARTYFSIGGGFVLDENQTGDPLEVSIHPDDTPVPYPFTTGDQLLEHARHSGLRISDLVMANELVWRSEDEVRTGLLKIWQVMQECTANGIAAEGVLPGGLKVPRRAHGLHEALNHRDHEADPLDVMDWVMLYALAVNEENAAGGRVVTAPTNGAAGIIPAVLHYYTRFVPAADDDAVVRFLLVAAGIGSIIKENASISGAEVGCQGEVGSACSMAAAGLAEVLGGTPAQVENAAEIGIEHNLGLTCDPVGGLVQIPCIERNAVASVKAITAARMAIRGDGSHQVSLDKAVKTMRETGADMKSKYKETARGGLALNVVEC